MEHTHLVKGLDYALLEKVRAEISNKEHEEEDAMEEVLAAHEQRLAAETKVEPCIVQHCTGGGRGKGGAA